MDLYNPTHSLRNLILQGICIVFGILALLLSAVNFYLSNDYYLGTGQVILSIYSLFLFTKLKQNTVTNTHINIYTAMLTLLIIYGVSTTSPLSGVLYWSFLLPAIYHVFYSIRCALFGSALLLVIVSTILLHKHNGTVPFPIINYTLMYIAIWAISCSHEVSRMKIQKTLENAALTDPLTGVKNRLSLQQDSELELKEKSELSALYLDIDLFKSINDNYGHAAGDQVLTFTAKLITNTANVDWVYRLGGEEFLIIVEGDVQHGFEIAEDIRQAIYSSKLIYHGQELIYSASIGVAKLDLSLSLEQALNPSDLALYQAKSDGRNKVCVNI
ncbi:GGDEF domain-containing protein [Vibrio kyushuensis]|uniref:GGDEF domain-containing protein n=1 Tax=Vibrio kyushuensis TaxID=2910249 RepID=UPI003D119CC8